MKRIYIAWKLTFVQFWLDIIGGGVLYVIDDERNREQIKNTTSVNKRRN